VASPKGDFTEQLADLVLAAAAGDPGRIAERTLRALVAYFHATRAALFSREQECMTLFSSHGADGGVLDSVGKAWSASRKSFASGTPVFVPSAGSTCAAIVPVTDGMAIVGLLFLEVPDASFGQARDMEALLQFTKIAAVALTRPGPASPKAVVDLVAGYLERTSEDDIGRDHLLVLLERNEWNIARVARLMGMSRVAIYKRLEKYGIERRRVPKIVRKTLPA
jgi:hypothetical protein